MRQSMGAKHGRQYIREVIAGGSQEWVLKSSWGFRVEGLGWGAQKPAEDDLGLALFCKPSFDEM